MLVSREATEAQEVGTAWHMATLQGRLFSETYYRAPDCPRVKKEDKEAHAQAQAENPGKKPLKADDYDMIQRMADAVYSHKEAREILEAVRAVEETLLWECPHSGAKCKALVDAACDPIIVDLKSCVTAKPSKFWKDFYEFGYDISGAHYLDSPFGFTDYIYVAVEKSSQHEVTVHRIPPRLLSAVTREVRELRARWKECQDTGIYRGYPEVIMDAQPPAWRLRELGLEG